MKMMLSIVIAVLVAVGYAGCAADPIGTQSYSLTYLDGAPINVGDIIKWNNYEGVVIPPKCTCHVYIRVQSKEHKVRADDLKLVRRQGEESTPKSTPKAEVEVPRTDTTDVPLNTEVIKIVDGLLVVVENLNNRIGNLENQVKVLQKKNEQPTEPTIRKPNRSWDQQ